MAADFYVFVKEIKGGKGRKLPLKKGIKNIYSGHEFMCGREIEAEREREREREGEREREREIQIQIQIILFP